MYARTNKRSHEGQIAAKDRREGLLVDIKKEDEEVRKMRGAARPTPNSAECPADPSPNHGISEPQQKKRGRLRKEYFGLGPEDDDQLSHTLFDVHHHISDTRRFGVNIPKFVSENSEDPGVKVLSYICCSCNN